MTTNGYVLHIGSVEIVQHHPDGKTTIRRGGREWRVATRFVIDFRDITRMERVVQQNVNLTGYVPENDEARQKVGATADKRRLNDMIDKMTPEAMEAFGEYRKEHRGTF